MSTSESQERQSDLTEEKTRMHEAADLLLAILASCNPQKIQPVKYWDHAQKALQVGASRSKDVGGVVSEMMGQIPAIEGALTEKASSRVYSIGQNLEARGDFQAFRRTCRKKAPYIVVLARHRKKEARKLRSEEWIDAHTKED